ncbi:MAG: TonB-dependent receptor [Burkholderiaceae bacterium]
MHKTGPWMGIIVPTFSGLLLSQAGAALAQQPALQLERVEITGSSLKRIEGEGALPVQVITREEIQRSGVATVEQLLQTVSAASSSGGLTTSSTSGANTGGISAVSLRGLTSLRTLVLINGRRVAPYGIGFTNDSVSVDVSSIPLAAIERVEVLKDGASAIYGSDAIAGVINFILRKDYKGVELTAEYGDSTQGGARASRITGTWGMGDLASDRYNVMVVASYQKEAALYGRERGFASRGYDVARQNTTTSGNTFPANIAAADGSFGSANPTAANGCLAPYSFLDPLFPADRCRFDPSPILALLPETERGNLFAAARFAIGDNFEGFAEASYSRSKIRTVIQPVPLSDQFGLPNNNPLFNQAPYNQYTAFGSTTIVLQPSSAFYPTAYVQGITGGATPDLLVRYRAAVNGNRDLTDIAEAPRLTFGVKGQAGGWDLDGAVLYSASKVREQINDGYPIYTRIMPLLNSGTVNFFGPNTPAVDAQLRASNFTGESYRVDSSITSVAAKAARELMGLPGGALAFAAGVEARREQYHFSPSAELAQGDISGYGGNIAEVEKSRNVGAFFAEVNAPIMKGVELNGAVRYDRYQGVGSSTTPKLSLRWQPVAPVLLRASVGQGFRAPSLQDLYAPSTTGVTTVGLSDPLRCPTTGGNNDCQTQFATGVGGNPALKPEKSNNQTFGLVFEPSANSTIAIDFFRVRLSDTISQGIAPAVILGDLGKYGSYVTRGAPDPAFPGLPGAIASIDQTNIQTGTTKVSGIDLEANWRFPAGDLGRFSVGLNGTYFTQYDTENPDGSFTGGIDQINATTGGVVPRWKHYLSLNWTRGPWSATLAQNYQKGYHDLPGTNEDTDPATNPGFQPRRVGAYLTYDAQLTYTGFDKLKLTLGVRNLFDRDPPYTNSGGQISFQSGYDPQYADPRGRFVYLRASYAFK